ncbi:MAG: class I SAM-dependent methyltransferase [Desulfobacterales bacterium]|jgi:SAM-dependent methyltransferase
MKTPKETPFNTYHGRYEAWFTRHQAAYHSELLAIRALLPWKGLGLEIGVGTGHFAAPPGVKVGVDPSKTMLTDAIKRGVSGIQKVAETLPFREAVFDYGLVVTTICFVDDAGAMLNEAHRVLKPGVPFIIGFVDRTSRFGRHYLSHQAENVFYREAKFYSALEVEQLLNDTGFVNQTWGQTLSKPLSEIQEIEPLREGHGHGGFVVVRTTKL